MSIHDWQRFAPYPHDDLPATRTNRCPVDRCDRSIGHDDLEDADLVACLILLGHGVLLGVAAYGWWWIG